MSQCRNTLETGSYVVGGPFCWPVIVACKMHGPMALRATIGIVGQISWFVIASLLINYFSDLLSPAATMEDGETGITAIMEASTTKAFSTTPIPTTAQPTMMWIGNIIWISSGAEWGLSRKLRSIAPGTMLKNYTNGTINLLMVNETETSLPEDMKLDILKRALKDFAREKKQKEIKARTTNRTRRSAEEKLNFTIGATAGNNTAESPITADWETARPAWKPFPPRPASWSTWDTATLGRLKWNDTRMFSEETKPDWTTPLRGHDRLMLAFLHYVCVAIFVGLGICAVTWIYKTFIGGNRIRVANFNRLALRDDDRAPTWIRDPSQDVESNSSSTTSLDYDGIEPTSTPPTRAVSLHELETVAIVYRPYSPVWIFTYDTSTQTQDGFEIEEIEEQPVTFDERTDPASFEDETLDETTENP